MQRVLPLLGLLLIVGYGVYNAGYKGSEKTMPSVVKNATVHSPVQYTPQLQKTLSQLHTDAYLKQYITDVINHGSDQLYFKKNEVMDAGFASEEDAEKIACYVMELSGRHCDTTYPSDAAGFYTSICGGCHGNDGKGLDGTYPDLTRTPLLGIRQREAFLRSRVAE